MLCGHFHKRRPAVSTLLVEGKVGGWWWMLGELVVEGVDGVLKLLLLLPLFAKYGSSSSITTVFAKGA